MENTVITGAGILQNITFTALGAPNAGSAITPGNILAELSTDQQTLTLTINVASAQIFDGRYRVTLDETQVTDVDGAPAAPYSEILTFEDTTRPEIVGVQYGYDADVPRDVARSESPALAGYQFLPKGV